MESQKSRKMTNKTALVLKHPWVRIPPHIRENKTITSWEAIEKFGASRLSAIIYELRKKHCINRADKIFTDRYGDTSTFTEYIYCGELTKA